MRISRVMIFFDVERDEDNNSFGLARDITVKCGDDRRHGLFDMSTVERGNDSIPPACCADRASLGGLLHGHDEAYDMMGVPKLFGGPMNSSRPSQSVCEASTGALCDAARTERPLSID